MRWNIIELIFAVFICCIISLCINTIYYNNIIRSKLIIEHTNGYQDRIDFEKKHTCEDTK